MTQEAQQALDAARATMTRAEQIKEDMDAIVASLRQLYGPDVTVDWDAER
jgi:phosphoglycerate-specific signal transduction histidine kinase